jgi:tetratricopeptide (TPR) repeat protein
MQDSWKSMLVMLAVVGASWAGTAVAERSCPEARSSAEARRLAGREFAAGQRSYEQGAYRIAIARFECSFDLVPHRDTLFNIGRTAEAAGEDVLALDRFQELLARYPDDPDRREIEERIRQLRARIQARQPVVAPPLENAAPVDEPPPLVFASNDDGADQDRERMTGAARGRRAGAWATFALGAASAIAAGALSGISAAENEIYMENRDNLGWSREELMDSRSRGVALESAGWALLGLSAASLVTSLILFLTSRDRSSRTARLDALHFVLHPQAWASGPPHGAI